MTKTWLVCLANQGGCVVKVAESRSKAKWAGFREMDGPLFGGYGLDNLFGITAHRIPAYDNLTEREAHDRYYTDHDPETGRPVDEEGDWDDYWYG